MEAEALLRKSGLRITQTRLEILERFLEQNTALSQQYFDAQFDKLDRITLYRTLKTFEKKGLIHRTIDGTDVPKFALCSDGCEEHRHRDHHAHFHCVQCGHTYCLDERPFSTPSLPEGFRVLESHLVIQGTCGNCN